MRIPQITGTLRQLKSTVAFCGIISVGSQCRAYDGNRSARYDAHRCSQHPRLAASEAEDWVGSLKLAFGAVASVACRLRSFRANTLGVDQVPLQALPVAVEHTSAGARDRIPLRELGCAAAWVSHGDWSTSRSRSGVPISAAMLPTALGMTTLSGESPSVVSGWDERPGLWTRAWV